MRTGESASWTLNRGLKAPNLHHREANCPPSNETEYASLAFDGLSSPSSAARASLGVENRSAAQTRMEQIQ